MKRFLILGSMFVFPLLFSNLALAQQQQQQQPFDNRGLIGVYVTQDDFGGMAIEGFVRNTPASRLNRDKQINRGDIIMKLAGQSVRSLNSLTRARNLIPFGKEGKMVLRDRRNNVYFVWIGRKDPAVARAMVQSGGLSEEAAKVESSDNFRYGGKGEGQDQADIRDPKTGKAIRVEGAVPVEGAGEIESVEEGSQVEPNEEVPEGIESTEEIPQDVEESSDNSDIR